MATTFSLEEHGIHVNHIMRNLSPARLYEEGLRSERGTAIAESGALVALSGTKTGRSPGDKRIVDDPASSDDIWWGPVNMKLDKHVFMVNRERAIDYLNTRDHLFVLDGFAGWDPRYRIKVRVVCARAYHALFMHNMLIRPTEAELESFGTPDYVIFNGGGFPANRYTAQMTSTTSVDLCFERKEFVILGTEYAGEMKKGIFTVMNYLMPKAGQLSMHCSATEGLEDGKSSILFGLSGTGKTTLSADPKRRLIGDDEHVWSDDGVFNIEGGCYAKVIDLSAEAEPDIYRAIRFGAVLENVVLDDHNRVDYTDTSITSNTRGSFPIEHMDTAKMPCVSGHPEHVIFLTCDAFGVLPPVSRLTPEQAMYHFISGYTAKVAGTEVGVKDPEATFSACFGAPFMVWHPSKYATLLAERLKRHGAKTWLVNTGWSGGAFGVGSRMSLKVTRAIIDAIYEGALNDVQTEQDPIFGLHVPTSCPGVPTEALNPRQTWSDKAAYDTTAKKLAKLFVENFEKFADKANPEVKAAGPRL